MRYLRDIREFTDPKVLRTYLEGQEEFLLECLRGKKTTLKPADMKQLIPLLAQYWKSYLNTPGVPIKSQNLGIVHCAGLINFSRSHKYSEDYRETIQDEKHIKVNSLEKSLKQQTPTTDDMRLVRDLRV